MEQAISAFAVVAKMVFAVAGLGAGLRLAQMARHERALPVHTWASGMVFVGGLGLFGYGAAPLAAEAAPRFAYWAMGFSDALERLALMSLALFIWQVFGRRSRFRKQLAGITVLVLVVDWIGFLASQQWPYPGPTSSMAAKSHLLFAIPLLWSTFETFLEWRRSKRRLPLGLVDPKASHLFFLWTIGCGSLTAACVLGAVGEYRTFGGAIEFLRGVLNLVVAVAIGLGFYPPAGYSRWVSGSPPT